jgi:hypothetical protein
LRAVPALAEALDVETEYTRAPSGEFNLRSDAVISHF